MNLYNLLLVLVGVLLPATASAHVYFTTPSDGEVVDVGASVDISWSVAVDHGPPNEYDLMFSMDGGANYEVLAVGLPGAPSTFAWTAPTGTVSDARLSLVQHGAGGYTFMNSVDFTVGASPGADVGVANPPDMGLIPRPEGVIEPMENVDVLAPRTGEEVLALLEMRCAVSGCHAAENPQAGLDLTIAAFPENLVDAPSETGGAGALVAGDCTTDGSELLARVRGEHGSIMPPLPEEPLSAEQVDALETWILSGAPPTGPLNEGSCPSPPIADVEESGGCSTVAGSPAAFLLGLLLLGARRRFR